MNRFIVVDHEEASKYDDPKDLVWEDAFDADYKEYVVDTSKVPFMVVFAGGSYESPEDNTLGRHYGGLVDLLNQVAAES